MQILHYQKLILLLISLPLFGLAQNESYHQEQGETSINSLYSDSSLFKYAILKEHPSGPEYGMMPYDEQLVIMTGTFPENLSVTKSNERHFYPSIYNKTGKHVPLNFNLKECSSIGSITLINDSLMILSGSMLKTTPKINAPKSNKPQLFTAKLSKANNTWMIYEWLQFNNPNCALKHPWFDHSVQRLFFSADLPDSHGGSDIYYVNFNAASGQWGEPVNMGNVINTIEDEFFPTTSEDTSFYFSSNGHFGLGDFDIYKAKLNADTPLQITNLGAPFNSADADFNIYPKPNLIKGYFSSNRAAKGDERIFSFERKKIQFELSISTKEGQEAFIKNPLIRLYENGVKISQLTPDEEGKIQMALSAGLKYEMEVEAENYHSARHEINIHGADTTKIEAMLVLEYDRETYVLGTVKNYWNEETLQGMRVEVIDKLAHKDTFLITDNKGEFIMPVMPGDQYVFIAQNQYEIGYMQLKVEVQEEDIYTYYRTIHTDEYFYYNVTVKDAVCNTTDNKIEVTNEVTGEQIKAEQISDCVWQFRAVSAFNYLITPLYNERSSVSIDQLLKEGDLEVSF